jgi:hypothetical protein
MVRNLKEAILKTLANSLIHSFLGNTTYACSLCKKQAKVVKLDELPDQLKNTYFVSDLKKILEDPIKIIEFQQAQEQKTLEIINNYVSHMILTNLGSSTFELPRSKNEQSRWSSCWRKK